MLFTSILSLMLMADEPKTAIVSVTDVNDQLRNYGGGHVGNNSTYINALRNVVLPVNLFSFKGQSMSGFNLLSWTSMSEQNNSHYEIFKATGSADFQFLGSVSGAGNSDKMLEYSYKDYDAKLSEDNYYKLRQVDFNGGFKDFKVVSLKAITLTNKFTARVDDNNNLNIYLTAGKKNNFDLKFYGINGELILADKLQANAGLSAYAFNLKKELVPGVYIVTLNNGIDNFSIKVIK